MQLVWATPGASLAPWAIPEAQEVCPSFVTATTAILRRETFPLEFAE